MCVEATREKSMSLKTKKICFVGAGNMASAIVGGLIKQGFAKDLIVATAPSAEHRQKMEASWGIQTSADNGSAVADADVVILSVKPQVLKQVCEEIKNSLRHHTLVISIAAGIELCTLEQWLDSSLPIVRCMPNTPAQVLMGASGLIANHCVTDEGKRLASELFSAVGVAKWVEDEALMHSVTALSGSGPAYIFMMIAAMEKAGVSLGLEAESARILAAQTVAGAAEMVLKSDVPPEQLKQNVMSPGGTTERAVACFESYQFDDIVLEAMKAAQQRSVELAKMLSAQ